MVLLDEVETLAVDRSKLSLDANPVDIHRATDAVLVQLDLLAETHKNLLFIATSNFPQAVDSAFISRCDLVLDVPLPNKDACKTILKDCLEGLGTIYPEIGKLAQTKGFDACADDFVGLDGRTIRKTVANALATNTKVALNPSSVSLAQLSSAATSAQTAKAWKGGR
ncbi:AAA family ATPase [Loktanella sp. M215]|uniref:AAA family ATPase n=1 Tax=Loktanella sp. M215 TaxID=2675431 RepID=UPI00301B0E40